MEKNSTKKIHLPNTLQQRDSSTIGSVTYTFDNKYHYYNLLNENSKTRIHIESSNNVSTTQTYIESTIERVSQWFLNQASMSNKKLQKLCYYSYCWFIVFNNDLEVISKENSSDIRVLCADKFQAWIHGPVCPRLYQRYKEYGWHNIPHILKKPEFPEEIESLLQQVWEVYGSYTADELEVISHGEIPWINARKGYQSGDACSNLISDYDILVYFSNLG